MVTINSLLSKILKEFSSTKKPVAVKTEGNVLVIKIDKAETRIVNWQTLTEKEIIETARGLVTENFSGRILLNE